MESNILVTLLKAGGASALSIGVLYFLYRELIKLRIFPRLKEWQAFAFLCLIAVLVFAVVAMAMLSPSSSSLRQGELLPEHHFQMDFSAGLFCERTNVLDAHITYFDYASINIGACPGAPDHRERAYRVDYVGFPAQSRAANLDRRNYRLCFDSDFSSRAPKVSAAFMEFFNDKKKQLPCETSISLHRVIHVTYNDMSNASQRVVFVQSWWPNRTEFAQIPAISAAQSGSMQALTFEGKSKLDDAQLLSAIREFGIPGIPSKQ